VQLSLLLLSIDCYQQGSEGTETIILRARTWKNAETKIQNALLELLLCAFRENISSEAGHEEFLLSVERVNHLSAKDERKLRCALNRKRVAVLFYQTRF